MALTERLAIVLDSVGAAQVVREFGQVGNAAQGLSAKLNKGLGKGGMMGLVGGGLAAAGAGLVAFGVKAVGTYTELAQSVLKFQRASGASAEQSSALIAAFDDMGIAAETGSKAIFQLGKRLEEDTDKLAAFGITAVKGVGGNTDLAATLGAVADAYQNTADPARRAAMLTAAFGRSGQELIPILEQGAQGIRDLYAGAAATGQILSQDDIDQAEEYRLAMDNLADAWNEFALVAGKKILPVLTGLANFLSGGEDDTAAAAAAVRDATDAMGEEAKVVEGLEKALLATSNAHRAVDRSARAAEKAELTLADARKDLNKLLKEGAVDEEKVADTRRSLNDATRSLAGANRDLAKAQEEHNDAQAAFLALPSDTNADNLRDATDGLADAQDGVAGAAEREKDAQQDLARAQAGDPEFNDKLAAAKLRVKDAEQGLTDAQHASAEAAYKLDEALTEQNTQLATNASAVQSILTNWDALLKRQPEIEAFLSGPMAALRGAAPTGTGTAPAAIAGTGGGLGNVGDLYVMRPGETPEQYQQRLARAGAPTSGIAPTTTSHPYVMQPGETPEQYLNRTTNVTVNVAGTNADPKRIAREVIWSLN